MMFPLLLTVSTALKTDADVRANPFGLFSSISTENIVAAWTLGSFGEYVLNSFLLSVPSTLLVVVLSTMGGYTFARLPFFGRTFLFYLVLLGLLVPFFAYMIPLYFQLRSMGLLDSLLGANLVLASTLDENGHATDRTVASVINEIRGLARGVREARLLQEIQA